jgi:REP element-mobilizing transposase RayT
MNQALHRRNSRPAYAGPPCLNLMPDHVHMLLSIPPKYAVSHVVRFIKGKSAIHLARVYGERKRNFVGQQ